MQLDDGRRTPTIPTLRTTNASVQIVSMADAPQKHAPQKKKGATEKTVEAPKETVKTAEQLEQEAAIKALLDEIDEDLSETEAEEFVRGFRQKGGQ